MNSIEDDLDTRVQLDPTELSFQRLYKLYWTKVYTHCLCLTKNHDLAQDFTQDIFVKLFNKLHTFKGKAHITTWLHTITFHYCLDQLKRDRRFRLESLSPQLEYLAEEDHYKKAYDEELAWRVYRELPLELQRLFQLKYKEGISLVALAKELNYTVPALKMRLLRGKHLFRVAYQTQLKQKIDLRL